MSVQEAIRLEEQAERQTKTPSDIAELTERWLRERDKLPDVTTLVAEPGPSPKIKVTPQGVERRYRMSALGAHGTAELEPKIEPIGILFGNLKLPRCGRA